MESDSTWAALVPELSVGDIARSLAFYVDVLGFEIVYERREARFAFLRFGRAQLMLDQGPGPWETGPREPPLGRGVNFEIEASSVEALCARLEAAGWPLFRPLETVAYRAGDIEHVQAQFLVQDPDGFLLRFVEPLGERPAAGPG